MKDWKKWKMRMAREGRGESDGTQLTISGLVRELRCMDATRTMSQALCRTLRDLVCEAQEEPDCRKCPLRNVDCYNTWGNIPMKAILMGLFGKHHAKTGEDKKAEYPSNSPESSARPSEHKTGISVIA